ncbi:MULTISPECIES: ABC transporter permease [Glutamicibacter]|uniref:ABC transporter permease n=7 Tax=Glutamicibacter arilaitensis TaxID=256701 RepID=A0A2N7RYP2_9MICC|nr:MULTISPECIES: ABC transporter permease [Glutamicibacter]PMQ18997.1 ABC transporter permease [Glutamicibacter arilaitensis]CBT77018.1 osmoprotectant (glycine betaine/carnitine/choline/L-proline) ABC transporter, inner membrane subunit [Glutamicibacter arilaitensis Re117]HCJ53239.1 ABC transporter permease [Glutamicibacter sp.]HCM93360.1 ABC transporter permease [Glutamicibacter sp.]
MGDFFGERSRHILFASWQHFSLVAQCLILATIISVLIAVLVYRNKSLSGLANGISAIGLTIPSFALIGLLIVPVGFGVTPAVIVVTFFAALPILRNAIVGLNNIEPTIIESARGIGMSRMKTLISVEIPIAWPVILTGVRISAQMVMGVAAVVSYALGPGLGGFIFQGLSRLGGANSLNSVITGVVGVVILALILDLILLGVGRLTTPRGIRV